MSNSHEQSLNEDVVFLPVTEACPEFLHCERERCAVECLLHAGQGAFYTCVSVERLGPFLSPEEVNQIAGWTQDFHLSQLQLGEEQNAEGEDMGTNDFSDCYFPDHSDTPAPCLELGWPERDSWMGRECSTVYTSPPADGQPPIREVIRRHLQGASQVIAIVTDRLTDSAVIGDLHNAASRGVPVYIILNQRSIEENFTPNRLRHPNMQVRVLGGKSFCSREGKMVTGDMKDNFVLVDLESVIHGSYSLTWTDAHLHRQLITVMRGPVVESFDREFRILFAASLPVPYTSMAVRPPVDVPHQQKEFSDLCRTKHLPPLEPVTSPPPPPPADSPLDWDALGVRQGGCYLPNGPVDKHEAIKVMERPLLNATPLDKKTSTVDELAEIRNEPMDEGRIRGNTTLMTNNLTDKRTGSNNTQLSRTDGLNSTSMEIQQRIEHNIERAYHRHLSKERSTDSDDRTTTRPGENRREQNAQRDQVTFSSSQRRERLRRENILEEEINMDGYRSGSSSRDENPVSSRRPIILRVPQRENFSSLSDIMRRLQPQQSTAAQHRIGSKTTVSELSRSMMDLSAQSTDQEERGHPVPRLQASYFDPGRLTPGFALMKRRNDDLKSAIYRTPIGFLPSQRPRSSGYGLQMDWGRPQTDREGGRKDLE